MNIKLIKVMIVMMVLKKILIFVVHLQIYSMHMIVVTAMGIYDYDGVYNEDYCNYA